MLDIKFWYLTFPFKLQFEETWYLLIFEIWSMGEWAANFCRNGFLKSKLNETDFRQASMTSNLTYYVHC